GFAAFEDINGITKLIIPASVTTLENWAFCGCTNLQTLIFEDGTRLSYVGAYATAACNSLSMVLYGGTPAQFASVSINNTNDGGDAHNGRFNAATKVFYSQDEPAILDNYYWYWVDKERGQIAIWGASSTSEE
ncbi:MAG: leucine-rich repeat protein, partial [Clostridia bacterium]|nr:leucine-rich repeat protein [Clostridia bacterium]